MNRKWSVGTAPGPGKEGCESQPSLSSLLILSRNLNQEQESSGAKTQRQGGDAAPLRPQELDPGAAGCTGERDEDSSSESRKDEALLSAAGFGTDVQSQICL